MGCRMSKAKKSKKNASAEENHIESLPADLDTMKRKDLQKLCKKHKLKAIGKVKILIIFSGTFFLRRLSLFGQNFGTSIPKNDKL